MVKAVPVVTGLLEAPECRDDLVLEFLVGGTSDIVGVEVAPDFLGVLCPDVVHGRPELILWDLPVPYRVVVECLEDIASAVLKEPLQLVDLPVETAVPVLDFTPDLSGDSAARDRRCWIVC